MVNTYNEIIKNYFKNRFPQFVVIFETSYSMYWGVKLKYRVTEIDVSGDIGGFSVNVIIDNSKFPLWQYDRSVNDAMETSEVNIFYQLDVLRRFLTEIEEN